MAVVSLQFVFFRSRTGQRPPPASVARLQSESVGQFWPVPLHQQHTSGPVTVLYLRQPRLPGAWESAAAASLRAVSAALTAYAAHRAATAAFATFRSDYCFSFCRCGNLYSLGCSGDHSLLCLLHSGHAFRKGRFCRILSGLTICHNRFGCPNYPCGLCSYLFCCDGSFGGGGFIVVPNNRCNCGLHICQCT